jgi:hypothetical protein
MIPTTVINSVIHIAKRLMHSFQTYKNLIESMARLEQLDSENNLKRQTLLHVEQEIERVKREQALLLAGKMADCAIALTGGDTLNETLLPANVYQLHETLKNLKEAAEEYNRFIIQWASEKSAAPR